MTKQELAKAIVWMMDKGYATGHGDTVVDLLQELEWQVAERERERIIKANAPEIEKVNAYIKALAQPVDTVDMTQERVDELKECVHEFFTKYLNYVEESDSGRLFNPVTIGCCRALMLGPLNELLERMRVLSGSEPNPCVDGAKVGEVGVWGEK